MSRARKKTGDEEEEVEQLLRAAQDDVLLKISLDSHSTRAAAGAIDPDLDRRYETLKNSKAHQKNQQKPKSISTTGIAAAASDDRIGRFEEDEEDLFARFATLKKSIPAHNRNESKSADVLVTGEVSDDDDDDEVEKVIKWAIDAARLDSSDTLSDDDVEMEKK